MVVVALYMRMAIIGKEGLGETTYMYNLTFV